MAVSVAVQPGEQPPVLHASDGETGPLGRWAARTVWTLTAVVVVGGGALGLGLFRVDRPGDALAHLLLLVVPAVGAVLATRRPDNPIGWTFMISGAAVALGGTVVDGRLAVLGRGTPSSWAAVAESALWPLGFPLMVVSLFWFPNGRIPTRRWAPVVVGALGAIAAAVVAGLLAPFDQEQHPGLRNPIGLDLLQHLDAALQVLTVAVTPVALMAAISIGVRYRRGNADTRMQIRWVAWIVVIQMLAIVLQLVVELFGDAPQWLVGSVPAPIVVGLPVVIAIAVVRHRLFDIDLLVNRTVVYALLSAAVVASYAAVLLIVGRTAGRSDRLTAVTATLAVAMAFQPLRTWLQRFVDRQLFGQRGNPMAVLASLSETASTSAAPLDDLVNAVARSLRLHHVALEVATEPAGGFEPIASVGSARGAPVEHVPIAEGSELRGRLLVARRSPHEPLRRDELTLLMAMATLAAGLVRGQRLTAELQGARERLVSAAEDERRRLRRELHDGLGSQLTGITYRVEATRMAARGRLDADRDQSVVEGLNRVKTELADAVVELRRIIEDLRPPALDDLGLVRAISGAAHRSLGSAAVEFELRVELSESQIEALSAATELVLYRIAVEGVTNVARHAHAHRCEVTLAPSADGVRLTVADDGVGIATDPCRGAAASRRAGLGLSSIHQRAEELGGRASVTLGPRGGTLVEVVLPVAWP